MMEHDTYQSLIQAATEEASSNFSSLFPALIYHQAGRRFIVTSFPIKILVDKVRLDTLRKGDDPDEHINRPLMPDHVSAIKQYLLTQDDYILPSITLSVRHDLRVHVMKGPYSIKLGQVVLPLGLTFAVTDGQHRIKALEEALRQKPELAEDGIAVTIVPEVDIDRVHQDFVDCAQVKPIPPALLTLFNQRDLLARMSRQVVEQVRVFKGRIEKVGKTVGKHSINLFTMNQVRAGIAELITGDSMQAGQQLKKNVEERLLKEGATDYYREAILRFYGWFTEANKQWADVADAASDPTRDLIDATDLRQRYVHFTATGLLIIGRVGYSILKLDPDLQKDYVTALAQIDWTRHSELWQGNIVQSNGKILTMRVPVETAIAKVKQAIDLDLTERDLKRLADIGSECEAEEQFAGVSSA